MGYMCPFLKDLVNIFSFTSKLFSSEFHRQIVVCNGA